MKQEFKMGGLKHGSFGSSQDAKNSSGAQKGFQSKIDGAMGQKSFTTDAGKSGSGVPNDFKKISRLANDHTLIKNAG